MKTQIDFLNEFQNMKNEMSDLKCMMEGLIKKDRHHVPELINIQTLSELTGLKESTIRVYNCTGQLPPTLGNGRVLWIKEDINKWLASNNRKIKKNKLTKIKEG